MTYINHLKKSLERTIYLLGGCVLGYAIGMLLGNKPYITIEPKIIIFGFIGFALAGSFIEYYFEKN